MATGYPSDLVIVGAAKEATFGTPVAPVRSLPMFAPQFADAHHLIHDTGWRQGSAATFGHQPGPQEAAVRLGGPAFADVIGWALAGVLGDVAVVGTTAPFTYTIAGLNSGSMQPPSYTLTVSDPVGPLAFAGCRFTHLDLSAAADGLLSWQADALGLPGVAGTTPSLTATPSPMQGWRGVITLNGSIDATCLDFKVSLSRSVTPKRNTNGMQKAYAEFAGQVSCVGSATVLLTSDAYRALLVNGTSLAVDANWAQGAGAAAQQIKMHSSTCSLDSASRVYAGDMVEMSLAWMADANTTDAGASGGQSPVKFTVQNAVPSGTYA